MAYKILMRKMRRALGLITPSALAARIQDNFLADARRVLSDNAEAIFYVGANIGQNVAPIRRKFPKSKIYCFEPFPPNFAILYRRHGNKKGIETLKIGISDKRGEMFIIPHENPTMVSLTPKNSGNLEKVDVETIDEFCRERSIDSIAILKIDIEGLELSALRGAHHMLSEHRIRCLYIESGINPDNSRQVHLDQIRAMLEPLGYRIMRFYEQVPEWPTRQPHLRRSDVAWLAPSVYGSPSALSAPKEASMEPSLGFKPNQQVEVTRLF